MLVQACGEARTEPQVDGEARESGQAIFNPERVLTIRVSIEQSAMAELAREPRDWVRGSVEIAGTRYDEVALRFKGHRTLRSWAGKPAFRLAFDKLVKGRRVHGLAGFALNNLVEDPTMVREQLASRVFASMGVPAPRTGFAEVFINDERFGLYATVEQVDEGFLLRHFGSAKGLLYEGEYGCDLYAGDVFGLELESGKDDDRKQLRELVDALDAEGSLLHAGPALDDARVVSFLATSALIGDFDGYRHGHNYRLYRDPTSQRWSLIPWGLDRTLKQRLSIWDSRGRLATRCFADAGCRLRYVKALAHAADRFEKLHLHDVLQRIEKAIARAVEHDPRRPHRDEARNAALEVMRKFIRERPAEIRAQVTCWDGSRELDRDGDGAGCDDCDDTDATVHPGAEERCDGEDDDCSGLADDAPTCPCATEVVGDRTFALCNLPMSWWRAEQFCAARGESLARVDGKSVGLALRQAATRLRESDFWVGLDDQSREGEFRWPDGTKPRSSLWAKAEPDDYACGQHCVALRKKKDGKLRDLHCATPNPFICESASDAK